MSLLEKIGRRLAKYLSKPRSESTYPISLKPNLLTRVIQPGDVLLVEGNSAFSVAIKYMTQSGWSHSALYVGDLLAERTDIKGAHMLIEADINEGVHAVPLSHYLDVNTRICRPVGLSLEEIRRVIDHAIESLGHQYDMKNIIDLARYLIRTPPIPSRWRRRLLAFGSGDPTQAICSSLIAKAFQSIRYPILPEFEIDDEETSRILWDNRDLMHIRHHSLFMPRDFDVSPYFQIIKPTLEIGFDPQNILWADDKEQDVPEKDQGLFPGKTLSSNMME